MLYPRAHQAAITAGTRQTRDFGVSISARILHSSKKKVSFVQLPPSTAKKSQPRERHEGPVTLITAFLLISFSMSELAGSQPT